MKDYFEMKLTEPSRETVMRVYFDPKSNAQRADTKKALRYVVRFWRDQKAQEALTGVEAGMLSFYRKIRDEYVPASDNLAKIYEEVCQDVYSNKSRTPTVGRRKRAKA